MTTTTTTTTILHCGITNNGNAVATTEDGSSRFLINKLGEFKTGAELQFPDHLLEDRVASTEEFSTPELMLRQYAARKAAEKAAEAQAKIAEKERAERLAAIPFSGSFILAERRVLSAEESHRAIYKEFAAFKASPALLRKALKKAEAAAAKQKELAVFKKLCEKTLASLKNSGPKSPLKGAGNDRADFPTVGNNKKMQIVLAAIPASHKDEIAIRRQKGFCSWHPIISIEASKKVARLIALANA